MEGILIFADAEFYAAIKHLEAGGGWEISAGTGAGQQILLGKFIEGVAGQVGLSATLPDALSSLTVEDVNTSFNTATGAFHLESAANASGKMPIRDKDCALSLGMNIDYDPQKADKKLTGKLDGSLTIGDVILDAEFNLGDPALTIKLDEGSKLNFKEVAEFFLGEELFGTLPQELADNLAGVTVTKFDSIIDFEKKGFALDITTTFKDITLGTDDLLVKEAAITLSLDISKDSKYCMLDVGGKGSIGEAVTFEDCKFKFEYDSTGEKTDWQLGGSFDMVVLEHELKVDAGYKDVDGTKIMFIEAQDPFPAIEFPGAVSFELEKFLFMVEKKDAKTSWALSSMFDLKVIDDIFTINNGTVALINEPDKNGLKLSADSIDMKIPEMDFLPWFSLSKPSLELIYIKQSKKWECDGKTHFIAHDVPDLLKKILPAEEVRGVCKINEQVAEVGICMSKALIPIPLPPDLSGLGIETGDDQGFGTANIGVKKMMINFKDGGSLSATLGLGLPEGINKIFVPYSDDGEEKQEPLKIFRTYDHENHSNTDETGLIGLTLSVSAKNGLSVVLDQSPFTFFDITENEEGRKVIDIDLHEFGEFSIDVPVLSLKPDGSFQAAGGFDIIRDLQIPLVPLKYFLDLCGLHDVSRCLADGIPVKGVDFYSQKPGETEKSFHIEAFFDLFTSAVQLKEPLPFPDWMKDAFNEIDDLANRLPADFLEYGNFDIPKHLHFYIDASAEGSVNFKVSVKGPDQDDDDDLVPIKFLVPNFPSLLGVKLYSLSVGELFSGTLIRTDIDMTFDQFDIPALLASLAIPYDDPPKDGKYFIANPKIYRNSFRIKNLVIIIIYETEIPIPIPTFYDELGYSYRDFMGTEIESVFKFPMPKPKLTDVAILISQFTGFFKDGKDLDLDKLGQIDFGNFTVGPNYIRLPKFISTEEDDPSVGKLVGTPQVFVIKPVKLLGGWFNAIKNGSINDLIQVIELEHRVNSLDLTIFGVLKTHFEYVFTTPYEFVTTAYSMLPNISQDEAAQYLGVLPPAKTGVRDTEEAQDPTMPITEDTQGLVIFMQGEFDIAKVMSWDAAFGLVGTTRGFGMGMQFNGTIDPVMDLQMRGIVAVKDDGTFLLEGDSQLKLLEQNILRGYFSFNNHGLKIKAQAGDGLIRLSGDLSGEFSTDYFHLKGDVSLVLLCFEADGEFEMLFSNSQQLLHLQQGISFGDFLKLTLALDYAVSQEQGAMAFSFQGAVSEVLDMAIQGSILASAGALQAQASGHLAVLETKVISLNSKYSDETFALDGSVDLFPDTEGLSVTGDVSGALSPNQFGLSGQCDMVLFNCPAAKATATITDTEMKFMAQLFKQVALIDVHKSREGYALYGTMSPIFLGTILNITSSDQADDRGLGGPSVLVASYSPYFKLDGKVSLLKIEADTDIVFDSEGFSFDASGKIFDAFEASLTVTGSHFENTDGITVEADVNIGDIAGDVSKLITEAATDIYNQLEAAKARVSDSQDGVDKAAAAVQANIQQQIQRFDDRLKAAQDHLEEKVLKENGLAGQINDTRARIERLKRDISDKKSWYYNLKWFEKLYKLVELSVYVAAKGVEIAALYAEKGLLEIAKLAATTARKIAKKAFSDIQALAERAAQTVDKGIEKLKEAADAALQKANEALSLLEQSLGALAQWSRNVLNYAGNVLTINSARFKAGLNSVCGGTANLVVDVIFLGKHMNPTISFCFLDPSVGINNLVNALKA